MLEIPVLLKKCEYSFDYQYDGAKLKRLAKLFGEEINREDDLFFSKISQKIANIKNREKIKRQLLAKIKLTSSIATKIEILCYLSCVSISHGIGDKNPYLETIRDLFQGLEPKHKLKNNLQYKELRIYYYCKTAAISRNYGNQLIDSVNTFTLAKFYYVQTAMKFGMAADLETNKSKRTKFLSQKIATQLYLAYIEFKQENYWDAITLAVTTYTIAAQINNIIENGDPICKIIFPYASYLAGFIYSTTKKHAQAVNVFRQIVRFAEKEPSEVEISASLEIVINFYLYQMDEKTRCLSAPSNNYMVDSAISLIGRYGSDRQRTIATLYTGHITLLYKHYGETLKTYKTFISACKKQKLDIPKDLSIIILYCRINHADKTLNQKSVAQLLKFLQTKTTSSNNFCITFEDRTALLEIKPLTHESNLFLARLITKYLNQYLYSLKTRPPKSLLSLITLWDNYKKTLAPKNTKSKTLKILATQSDYLRFLDVSGKNSIDLAQKYLESELLQQYIASTTTKEKLFRLIKSEEIRKILNPIYTIEEKEEKNKHHTTKNRRKRKKKKNRKKPNNNRQPSKQNENSRKKPPTKKPTKEDILLQQMLEHEEKIKKEIREERRKKEKVESDRKQLSAIREIFTENETTCSDFIKILNTITQFFSEISCIRDNNKKILKFISLSESYGGYKKTVPNIIKTYREEKLRKKIETETRLLKGIKSIFTKYKISSQEFIKMLRFFPDLAVEISGTDGDDQKLLKLISVVATSGGYEIAVPRIIKKHYAEHSAFRELQHKKINLLENIPEKYISIAKQFNAMFFGGLFRNKLNAYFTDKKPTSSHDYDLITLLPEHELLRKLKQLQSKKKFRCFEKKGFGARRHYRIEFFDGKSIDIKFTNNSFKTIEEFVAAHARTLDFARNTIHVTHEGEIIDPMKGILAIKNKVLVPLQHNWCQKDNIQMFRALRFIFQDDLPVATNSSDEIEGDNEFVSQFTKPNSKEVPLPNEFNCANYNAKIIKKIKDNKECFYPEFPEARDLYLIINNLDKLFLTGKGVKLFDKLLEHKLLPYVLPTTAPRLRNFIPRVGRNSNPEAKYTIEEYSPEEIKLIRDALNRVDFAVKQQQDNIYTSRFEFYSALLKPLIARKMTYRPKFEATVRCFAKHPKDRFIFGLMSLLDTHTQYKQPPTTPFFHGNQTRKRERGNDFLAKKHNASNPKTSQQGKSSPSTPNMQHLKMNGF